LQGIFPSKNGTLLVGPYIKGFIAASFACFALSLALAALNMHRYTNILGGYLSAVLVPGPERDHDVDSVSARWTFPLALFWLGLASFGTAALINLYR